MARKHGITTTTYDNLVIDSGAVYYGFTDFITPGTLIGATRGGNVFKVETEYREIEVDGARGPVKKGRRITRVLAQLTVNLIEQSLANFKKAIPGSTSAAFNTDWDKISRSLGLSTSDYISNVVIIGDVIGKTGAIGLQINNCIADSSVEMTLADKEEGVLPITFTGHFTESDLDTEPWNIIYPNT